MGAIVGGINMARSSSARYPTSRSAGSRSAASASGSGPSARTARAASSWIREQKY